MSELIFKPETHEYVVNGVVMPSVTQIIHSAGLINFDKVPAELLERNAAFGNAVHKAIELKCKGTLDENSVDELIRSYLRAWDEFVLKFNYQSIQYEYRAYSHALRVGFTIDNIGNFPQGSGIVDIKTGLPKAADIIQTCGYGLLYPAKRLLILYLKDGNFKVLEIKGQDRKKGERLFLSSLALYNFRKKEGLL